ncbi:hypothetical protein RB195_003611 [Necator americanus]|uniref:WAPL domain-containing protein n=1 Tax=Necator americanus TaxID=51031 RepID=A0ABR1DPX4_NECAM
MLAILVYLALAGLVICEYEGNFVLNAKLLAEEGRENMEELSLVLTIVCQNLTTREEKFRMIEELVNTTMADKTEEEKKEILQGSLVAIAVVSVLLENVNKLQNKEVQFAFYKIHAKICDPEFSTLPKEERSKKIETIVKSLNDKDREELHKYVETDELGYE